MVEAFPGSGARAAPSSAGFTKLYDRKTPLTAADLLNDRVVAFFEEHGIPLSRVLTDRGTAYCGQPDHHEYELYLAVEHIDHTRTKTKHPQTNGICERFNKTVLNELYRVAFRKKLYHSLEEVLADLDAWLREYNEQRTHQGRSCTEPEFPPRRGTLPRPAVKVVRKGYIANSWLVAFMIGVLVTFRYGADFDAAKIRKVAEMARSRFEGMPGLRSKAFTLNPEKREAINVYIWDAEAAAKAFFDEELVQRVTGLYGVRPSVSFVEVAALVDNAASK